MGGEYVITPTEKVTLFFIGGVTSTLTRVPIIFA